MARLWLLCLIGIGAPAVLADIRVVDDMEQPITLQAPAARIVSLAPHVTELLFAIGAGSRIVGTSDFSDFPPAARALPRIGGSRGIDVERVAALQPDLVIGWGSGNPRTTVQRMRRLGVPIFLTQPRRLVDIARNLRQLGRLTGMHSTAEAAAASFLERYRTLAERYAGRRRIRVFYQVLDPQIVTVNGKHVINEVMELCGAKNIFADLSVLAPVVNEEAVLRANPDAIVAGGVEDAWRHWQAHWMGRRDLRAVQRGALYLVSADLLHRHAVRILDGAEALCEAVEDARQRERTNR